MKLFILTSSTRVWGNMMLIFLLILKLSHIIDWFELVMRLIFPSAGQVCKIASIYGWLSTWLLMRTNGMVLSALNVFTSPLAFCLNSRSLCLRKWFFIASIIVHKPLCWFFFVPNYYWVYLFAFKLRHNLQWSLLIRSWWRDKIWLNCILNHL